MHTNNNYRMICKRNINDVGPTNSDVGGGGGAGAGYGLYQAAGAAAAGTGAYQHPNSWALEPQSSWPMTVGGGGGGYFLQQQQLLRQQQQQQLQSVPQLVPIGNRRNGGITTTNSSILQFHPSPPRYNHSHNLSYSHFNTNFNNVSNNNISNTHFNTNTYFSNSLATVSQWPMSVIGDEEEEERVVKEEEEELEDDDDSKLQELVNSFDLDLDNIEVPRRAAAAPLESSTSSSLSLLGEHSAAFLSLKELAEAADFEPDNEVPRPPPAPAARRASHPQQQPRGRSASVLSILDEHDHFEGTSSNGGGIEVSQPVRRPSQPRRQSSSGSGSSSLLSSSSGSGSEHHFYRRRSSGALSVLSSSSDHPASFKEQLYKTELCRNMAELGVCDFGKECYFAHSEAEKRQAEGRKLHPNHRTVHCIEWNRGNVCKFGRRCAFIHRKPKTAFSVVGVSEETGKPELSPALWDALLSCGDFEPRLFGESALI